MSDADRPWVARLMRTRWGSEIVVARGVVYEPATLDGFIAWEDEHPVGLVTYQLDDGCEIVTIDSLEEGRGIGTALLKAVEVVALDAGGRFVWLITTNDNERAQDWYRRRGFEVVAVHEGALARSRELKPEIPLVNRENGLPIRDEIELRRSLG